jgi:hypothetical protein|tara:strand:+ start:98 stop:316 length:219 start_codon:yes stop_codon:yes gene_type:complete
MRGVNPQIRDKIMSLLGDNPPTSLIEFFEKVMEEEVKQETQQYTQKDVSDHYKILLEHYSQEKSIIEYLERE